MADIHRIGLDEVARHFEELEDPRSTVNRQHPLVSVVVIALMAVLAGAERADRDRQVGGFERRVPLGGARLAERDSAQGRLSARLGAAEARRVSSLFCELAAVVACDGRGGDRRGATDAGGRRQDGAAEPRSRAKAWAPCIRVSVWASEFGLSLGQVACAEKSNEITAIPELLRLVDIKGAIITIDAMGTQKAIAEQIIEGEADYVLALKGNQETLHQAVIDYIDEQSENDFADVTARRHVTEETGHGREETRSYIQMPVPQEPAGARAVERSEVDRHGGVGVHSRRERDDRDSLLHQQSGGEREAIRPRRPQSLGHREQLSLESRCHLSRG